MRGGGGGGGEGGINDDFSERRSQTWCKAVEITRSFEEIHSL